ncbi:hypothetical protein [Cupriavidus sp. CuC1]|uniref:hypothetical protein n=1 Tax=Cupriavidus sp. CuC1 TaxID=3373131 RepID=UPI0037D07717
MDWMTPDMLKALLGAVATAGGIYGGIRADLGRMAASIKAAADSAKAAHDRLDRHLEHHQ